MNCIYLKPCQVIFSKCHIAAMATPIGHLRIVALRCLNCFRHKKHEKAWLLLRCHKMLQQVLAKLISLSLLYITCHYKSYAIGKEELCPSN